MSRLDSFIRRLEAQRACLDQAAALMRALPGPVLELGLGAGRTYDHLCELLPEHEIFVFERNVAVHPRRAPDPAHLVVGDFCETLAAARARFEDRVVLAHADIGTWDDAQSAALAARIAPLLDPLMQGGGVVVSDQGMGSHWAPLPLPQGVASGRYYMYKVLR